jgi:CRISPR-associated protein (TIGR02584 family)
MSPAVLTETVWALAQQNPPVVPDQVIVLTTSAGRKQIRQELFTEQPHFNGQRGWDCLLQRLQKHGHAVKHRLRFDPDSDDLHVLALWQERSRRKRPLNDIRTATENEAVADCILEVVRGIVENPDTRLIASIAGGRKTMGTLLYACMTLIGRETDRITHVLVNEPFDDPQLEPKFYFPGQPQAELEISREVTVNAQDARVVLADIPFVPVRRLLTEGLGQKPGGFMTLVAQCRSEVRQRAAAGLKLVVHRSRPVIEVNRIPVELSPREQLLVLFLSDRVLRDQPPFGMYKDGANSLNEYGQELRSSAPPSDFSDWRWGSDPGPTFDDREIVRVLSDLRKRLREVGPDAAALIDRLPKHGRLSLDLQRQQISIEE